MTANTRKGIRGFIRGSLDTPASAQRNLQPMLDGWWDTNANGVSNRFEMANRKMKTAFTSRASVTAVAADPDLSIPITVGTWRVRGVLRFFSASVTPGAKFDLGSTWTSTNSGIVYTTGGATPVQQAGGANFACTAATVGAGIGQLIIFEGVLAILGSGNFEVRWAQSASNVTPTLLHASSYISAELIV